MGAQHTPGPWSYKAEGGRFIIDNQPGRAIACTAGFEPTNEANARLIAAAPELLEAAETVLAGLNARIDAADPSAVPIFSGIADLHSAIAKARGDQ